MRPESDIERRLMINTCKEPLSLYLITNYYLYVCVLLYNRITVYHKSRHLLLRGVFLNVFVLFYDRSLTRLRLK